MFDFSFLLFEFGSINKFLLCFLFIMYIIIFLVLINNLSFNNNLLFFDLIILFLFTLQGSIILLLSSHLFIIFFSIELMTLPLCILLCLNRYTNKSIEASKKYLF